MTYKLLCLDMDGVLVDNRGGWEGAWKGFNTLDKLEGLLPTLRDDPQEFYRIVISELWKGKDVAPHLEYCETVPLMPGISELFRTAHEIGLVTAIISSGPIELARRIQRLYQIDHVFANTMFIRDGKVTGEFAMPIGNGTEFKVKIVQQLCNMLNISMDETIHVGDSVHEIEMFRNVGLSIAFNSTKTEVEDAAEHVVKEKDLSLVAKIISGESI